MYTVRSVATLVLLLGVAACFGGGSGIPMLRDARWVVDQLKSRKIAQGSPGFTYPKAYQEISYRTADNAYFNASIYVSGDRELLVTLYGTRPTPDSKYRLHSACVKLDRRRGSHFDADVWYFCDHELLKKHIELSIAKNGHAPSEGEEASGKKDDD